MLHSCSEQMQSDDILPPPEAGSLPHHITAEHQSTEVFPAESFPAATALLEQQETKLLLEKVGIFQPDVSSHMHSVSATEDGQQMLLKQEALSPTDLVTPGTSGCGEGAYARCSAAQVGSPSSPIIPLTALELISQDSDSSGSDTAQASSSGGRPARRSSTSGGTLDRRKVSDDADSSDDTLDEDMSVDDQGRLDRRRLSNRVAAQKCRTRQRQHYRGLMKEIQDWECKNTGLNYEVRQLQKTLKTMLQKVSEHEAHCTTGKSALTPAEKEAYQKLIDDVTASLANPKDSGKPSK